MNPIKINIEIGQRISVDSWGPLGTVLLRESDWNGADYRVTTPKLSVDLALRDIEITGRTIRYPSMFNYIPCIRIRILVASETNDRVYLNGWLLDATEEI